ncbi:MAG: hypothetical protein M0P72_00470 [Metallibacterium scheffleri]|jgi:hypothetical protein|uniref:hypothetical protein n=1 Tax=Metallibacterium scheffleri TaxID=993689 RepID=UPI0026ED238E|nr:hypothetical protein [Metallibacterium scheffleri]MCK9365623.1 hypothetical protein [Metallibacterium scheffleri]
MNALPAPPAFLSLPAARGARLRVGFVTPRETCGESWLTQIQPAVALQRVGLTFSLCRVAQHTAAQLALHAAAASAASAHATLAAAVRAEWLREHAINLQLAWPRLLRQPEEPALVRALIAAAADARTAPRTWTHLLEQNLLGMPATDFVHLDMAGLRAWCDKAATPLAARFAAARRATPALTPQPMLAQLSTWTQADAHALAARMRSDAGFSQRPHWDGVVSESGAGARQFAHPLLAAWRGQSGNDAGMRMLARLLELALAATDELPAVSMRAWKLHAGEAMAAVDTARGPLLHWLRIRAGQVVAYRILAPTEWNFRGGGVLEQALTRCGGPDDAQARAWVLALDPCAECRVERSDA